MKLSFLVIPILLVQGCTSETRVVNSDGWKGKPISIIIERSGPPSKTITLASGEKEYIYERSTQIYSESHGGYGKDTLSPKTVICTTDWLVSSAGVIESVETRGNRCPQNQTSP